jgi:hypothetical protein
MKIFRGRICKQSNPFSSVVFCLGLLIDHQSRPGGAFALKKRSNPGYSHASEIAVIYAAFGEKNQAMTRLAKGYEERFNPGVLLRPGFDPLRFEPQFQELVRRIGLSH